MILTLAGALAVQQRKADRHGRGHAGGVVADGDRQLRRRAVAFADAGGDPGIGGSDIVESGLAAERAGLAGERDRAHDQLGIDPRQRVVTESAARHHAGREILHHDVALADEGVNERAAAFPLDVDGERFLRMIVLKIIGALRRFLQRRITRLVAGETPAIAKRRELELDHLGAELGEDAPAGRRRRRTARYRARGSL